MLEQCCKDQKHTILYAKLSHEYSGNAALSELFDKKWSMDRDTENRKEQANLETQLTEKRNQALREEERLCLVRLTQFHHTKGDIESALRTCGEWFSKCQSDQHKFECSMKSIELLIEQRNISGLNERIAQASSNLSAPTSRNWATANGRSRLALAEGLYALNLCKVRDAAVCFCRVSKSALASLRDMCSMADIATMGALCGLASFTRQEVKEKLLEHSEFTEILENAPAIHAVVKAFHNIEYQSGLDQLSRMQSDLLLNPFIGSHLHSLMTQIKELALSQYVVPFVSVRLQALATAFNMSIHDVEATLCNLIERRQVVARINSVDKLLVADDTDHRSKTLKDVAAAAATRVRIARGKVVTASVARICQLQAPR